MSAQVLVVGAGPAGLTMAIELKRYGVPVRIIEKASAPSQHSRALFVWPRTLELLERAGCAAPLVAAGHKVERATIMSADRVIGHVNFDYVASPYAYALMLPQAQTEAVLSTHLAGLGVQVERGVELSGFTQESGHVAATLRHADGREERIQTPWLIGCDGGGSLVRKTLGLASTGAEQRSDWLLADVHLEGYGFAPNELASFWHEDGFLAIHPFADGLYRVIADIDHAQGTEPDLAMVQRVLDVRGPGGLTASAPVSLSTFWINERNATKYRVGRVFLAGDAAHLHNPIGAQGMNMGIHDAVNLAWKLAMVERGTANADALLDSYNAERHAIAEHVIANIGRVTVISLMHNPITQRVRNFFGGLFFGLAPARQAVAERLSEVSLTYVNSPLNGPEDHAFPGPGPGERLSPQPGQTPVGQGDAPRFALLAEPSPELEQLRAQYAHLLEPTLRPPLSPRCLWLVRPDGYIAAVTLDPDLESLRSYLRRF